MAGASDSGMYLRQKGADAGQAAREAGGAYLRLGGNEHEGKKGPGKKGAVHNQREERRGRETTMRQHPTVDIIKERYRVV